jgi:hypothetical protein
MRTLALNVSEVSSERFLQGYSYCFLARKARLQIRGSHPDR